MPVTPDTSRPHAGGLAPRSGRLGGWPTSLALGAVLLAAYLANGREIGSYDTEGTNLTALALLRGDGPHLDRFRAILREPDGRPADYVSTRRGHVVSRYPIAPALIALPFIAPQVVALDRLRPGWDRLPWEAARQARRMAKVAAAIVAALVGVALHRLLLALGLGRGAVPAVLAAGLGSNLWMIASQALWQHGPAALALTVALWALATPRPSSGRLALAGIACGTMVACRSIDVVFAAAVALAVLRAWPRGLLAFLPGPIVLGAALVGFNLTYFDAVAGGQVELEAMHERVHGVGGPWSGNLVEGAFGTLVSPSRGLFVYTPWAAVALVLAPFAARRLRAWPAVWWAGLSLVPFGLMLSKYAVWWAGHTFGPRYWTESMPLFAVLLAAGLDWVRTRPARRARTWAALVATSIGLAVAIQALGACLFPSGWNLTPTNVDTHHERLWDWKDTELSRGLGDWLKGRGR